jgi:hypothetical protein
MLKILYSIHVDSHDSRYSWKHCSAPIGSNESLAWQSRTSQNKLSIKNLFAPIDAIELAPEASFEDNPVFDPLEPEAPNAKESILEQSVVVKHQSDCSWKRTHHSGDGQDK